jgi:hypothetical protein
VQINVYTYVWYKYSPIINYDKMYFLNKLTKTNNLWVGHHWILVKTINLAPNNLIYIVKSIDFDNDATMRANVGHIHRISWGILTYCLLRTVGVYVTNVNREHEHHTCMFVTLHFSAFQHTVNQYSVVNYVDSFVLNTLSTEWQGNASDVIF